MAVATRAETARTLSPAPSSTSNPAAQPKVASKRNPLHPEDVSLSPAWFAAAAVGGLAGIEIIRRFGWPGAVFGGMLGGLIGAYATLVEPRRPVLERFDLHFANLPAQLDGLRIGQISDSHLGVPGATRNLRWAVRHMQRERPDLLVFTGDFTHKAGALHQLPGLLHSLSAPLGVYAVPGNHDYWEGVGALRAMLGELGISLLMNEHRRLTWNGGDLWLLGTDDVWDGTPELETTLSGVPLDAFTVLLAHTPHDAPSAAKLGVDLQLSGHTHGGHMVLPLLGPIARPRYTGPFLRGMFRVGQMVLYVSRGIGGMPLRMFSRPEATIITLRRGTL